MDIIEDSRRREQIVKTVTENLESLESELKSELVKVKRHETMLPGQQLDYYLIQLWTMFTAYNTDFRDRIAKIENSMRELLETGVKELEKVRVVKKT